VTPAGAEAYRLDYRIDSPGYFAVDNVYKPGFILVRGIDFDINQEGLLVYDPSRLEGLGDPAQLWLSDALIDRGYVYDFLGYILGVDKRPSTPYYFDLCKMVHGQQTRAVSRGALTGAVMTILDVPYTKHDHERVVSVDGDVVVTDQEVYRTTGPGGPAVSVGDELDKYTPVGAGVEVHFDIGKPESPFQRTATEPSGLLHIPPSLMGASFGSGVAVPFPPVNVIFDGEDGNGNKVYRFDLPGESAFNRLWASFTRQCEEQGVPMGDYFTSYDLRPARTPGMIVGRISPALFFLSNFLGGDTTLVAIDYSALSATGQKRITDTRLLSGKSSPLFGRMIFSTSVKAGSHSFYLETAQVEGVKLTETINKNESSGAAHDVPTLVWVPDGHGGPL